MAVAAAVILRYMASAARAVLADVRVRLTARRCILPRA